MASSSQQPPEAVQAVLAALDTLYKNPDGRAKATANAWLQDFQSTPEAWETANTLLLAQDLPLEPRLFAAQTFRQKTTFDLDQVPEASRVALRSTLLTALTSYIGGPRVVQTQLCLTLSALALQLTDGADPEWGDRVIPDMIERFGSNPASVVTLLEFLTVLPEEINMNHRIPVDNAQYSSRSLNILSVHSGEVLKLLSMYIQAEGITPQIQNAVFQCLRSWLKAGEITAGTLLETPLFALSFDALQSDSLFDVAVDVLCDLIHETQETHDNMAAIEQIVPRLLPLRADLAAAANDGDDDKVRGLCRLFVQAGETYHHLILQHKAEFLPLVETIAECAAYNDLDIVQITFRFWYVLSNGLGKARQDASNAPFLALYERLLGIIIGHMRFPDDADTMATSATDEFREFRHYMGDTLKDCCYVLGSKECLAAALHRIQAALAQGASGSAQVKWQDIEAPLFSMRAMGREADPQDNDVTPQIIDALPSLPEHPKLKYAALLVVCRYAEWVNYHPDRIPALLSYISSGLTGPTAKETGPAAAQALNFLCQDCKSHLVPYLPQLFAFFQTLGDHLSRDDLTSIAEAIAYIVRGMPPSEGQQSLLQFAQPLLEAIASVADNAQAGKEDLARAALRLEMLEGFFVVIGDHWARDRAMAAECSKTCSEGFAILDRLMTTHGSSSVIAERICPLLRRGLAFFGQLAVPTVPAMLERLAVSFERSGHAAYVWVIAKVVDGFALEEDAATQGAIRAAFESVSQRVVGLLSNTEAVQMQDVIADYNYLLSVTISTLPSLVLLSPILPHALRTSLACLTFYDSELVVPSLRFLRDVVGNPAFEAASVQPSSMGEAERANLPAYGSAIRAVLTGAGPGVATEQGASSASSMGKELTHLLIAGLTSHFNPDTMQDAIAILRLLVAHFSNEGAAEWIASAAHALPSSCVAVGDRQRFLEAFASATASSNLQAVRSALQGLYAASRRARERAGREGREGNGGEGGAGLLDVDRS